MQRVIVIRVFLVDLGDVEHTRHCVLLTVSPSLFGADARTGLAGCDDQRGLRNAQCALHFTFKIKETRGIEQIDLAAVPLYRRYSRGNGKLALDLFGIKVTNRDLANAVGYTGDIEQALDQRGLAVAAVTHQTYITDLVNRIIRHSLYYTPLP